MISRYVETRGTGDAGAPDVFVPGKNCRPSSDFVVTRSKTGEALSLYGEMSWNRTPYSTTGREEYLYFTYWHDDLGATERRMELVSEIKWIMFILMNFRIGSSYSNGSLQQFLRMLRYLTAVCERRNTSLFDVFSDCAMAARYLDLKVYGRRLSWLFNTIGKIPPEHVGFEIAKRSSIRKLKNAIRRYAEESKQYPPIPSRIYSIMLSNLHGGLEEIERVLPSILALAKEAYSDPFMGIRKSQRSNVSKALSVPAPEVFPDFQELLERHGLAEYWASKKFTTDRRSITTALIEIQITLFLVISAYSGMRADELIYLALNCLETVVHDGQRHYLIRGRSTKPSKGKILRVKWVTSESAGRAVNLAREIARFVYEKTGVDANELRGSPGRFFLFISPYVLVGDAEGAKKFPTRIGLSRFERIRDTFCPHIEQGDLDELYLIDPHRAWDSEEKFQVGKPWPLTNHQLRRSLALYAQRSGLVSLPSLKRQLQHITLALTGYYGNGFSFAVDMLGTGYKMNDFAKEWLETQPVSRYLGYSKNVLTEDREDMFGGHASWLNARLRDKRGIIREDRAVTLKRFKKGELSYVPTPVGGCVNPGPCDRNPIDVLQISCIEENCKHLVGSFSKTERVIAIKIREVERLRAGAGNLPELRHEESELKKLIAGYDLAKTKSEQSRGKGS